MPGQLIARNVGFRYGPTAVLEDVSLTVAAGDRIGIVADNGVGKSTLLRLLAGQLEPTRGTVTRSPATLAVDLLAQEPHPRPGETTAQQLRRLAGATEAEAELAAAAAELGRPGQAPDAAARAADRYDAALDRYLQVGAADIDARIAEALADVGLGPRAGEQATASLSGGEATKVALGSVLVARGDILLLDEPTNNVDRAGLELLEQLVTTTPAGVVLVSHDRAFLAATVSTILEIDAHSRTSSRFEGGWNAYLEERATARRHAEEAYATYQVQRTTLAQRAQREREWSTQGARKARKGAPDNDKIVRNWKVASSEQVAARARRTERAMERLEVVSKPFEGWELRLTFAAAPRAGDVVASVAAAVVEQGPFRLGPVDLTVGWGERLAIAGPNGSGKTTLLGALLGDTPLASGTRLLGPGVVLGRLDQARTRFDGEGALLDAFMAETALPLGEARSVLAKLGIDATKASRPARALSPGERTRAALAAFASVGVNVAVLDEPTNHLDLAAIEQLEAALDRFTGTLIVVSHDRTFLQRLHTTRRVQLAHGRIVADDVVA